MIRNRSGVLIASLFFCFLLVLLLMFGDVVSSAAAEALRLSVSRVLPPLFPFMVLSSLIVSLNLFEPFERFIPARWFRLPDCAGSVLLLGLVCGFPVGAASACRLCEEGRIGRKEAGLLVALSSAPSPAFLIGVVGALWHSRVFGVFLWAAEVILTLLCGLLFRPRGGSFSGERTKTEPLPRKSVGGELCRSIAGAAAGCLNVTAYLVFFRIAGALGTLLIPPLSPLFFALFEFSSGCAEGARIGGIAGGFLTGFSAGFGGLSVFLQLTAYTEPSGVPFSDTLRAAAFRGLGLGMGAAAFRFFAGL